MSSTSNIPDMEEGEDRKQHPAPRHWLEQTTREVNDATSEHTDKPVNEDDYNSDVDYYPSSSPSPSTPSSPSSPDLPTPLFPTPLPSTSSIHPRWTHITTLQTHSIAQYNTAHAHLGLLNLQLASPTPTQPPNQRRRHRRLLQSSRNANIKILLRAMLHVARLTGEKLKLHVQGKSPFPFTHTSKPQTPQTTLTPPPPPPQPASSAYKLEHQRQLWQQHGQGQGAAVVYGMMEAWWSRERYRVAMEKIWRGRVEKGGGGGGVGRWEGERGDGG